MSSLELCPVSDHLEENEVASLKHLLLEADLGDLEESDDPQPVALPHNFDDDAFDDFWDQLDANEAACEIYLPMEFEEVFELEGRRIGSAHSLLLALANMREDMFTDDEDDDDDDDDEGGSELDDELDEFDEFGGGGGNDDFEPDENPEVELKAEQLRAVWKAVNRGAKLSIKGTLALFVHE